LLARLLTTLTATLVALDAPGAALFLFILQGSRANFIPVALELTRFKKWVNNLFLLEWCRRRC
jgi:hypothetical protein